MKNYHNYLSDICQSLMHSVRPLSVLQVMMAVYEKEFLDILNEGVQRFFMISSKIFACLEYMHDQGLLQRTENAGVLYYAQN